MVMNNSEEINKKLDQLIELTLRSLIFSMYKAGHSMDQICKNLHIRKTRVVKFLEGLEKKKVS